MAGKVLALVEQMTAESLTLPVDAKHKMFLALFLRCYNCARAVLLLSGSGFVDESFALTRVMTEALVNAAYIVSSDGLVADDFANYPYFKEWEHYVYAKSVDPALVDFFSPEDAAGQQAAWARVAPRYEKNRNKDWCKDNLFERAKRVDEVFGFTLLRGLINVCWRRSSAFVHSTADSLLTSHHRQHR